MQKLMIVILFLYSITELFSQAFITDPWSVSIIINQNDMLYIGTKIDASDNFDIGIDVAKPPPPPDWFVSNNWGYLYNELFGLSSDFRNSLDSVHTWILRFDYRDSGTPPIKWIISEFPEGDISGCLNIEGIDMLSTSSSIFDKTILEIHYEAPKNNITNISASHNNIPNRLILYQNYPNPFNLVTFIDYALPFDAPVDIMIYDILGKEIIRLEEKTLKKAGFHCAIWDGYDNYGNASSTGVYILKLIYDNEILTRKMLLSK